MNGNGDRLSDLVGPFRIVPDVLDADERLTERDRLVYGALLRSFRRGATSGNPPIVRVAERAGVSPRTARRALERLGELEYLHRRHEAGRPVHYTVARLVPAADGNPQLPGFGLGGRSELWPDTVATAQRERGRTSKTLERKAEGPAAAPTPNGNPDELEVRELPARGTLYVIGGRKLDPYAPPPGWGDEANGNGKGAG